MLKRIGVLISATVVLLSGGWTAWSQSPSDNATINGRVVDLENHPVSGARISIFPMDQAISGNLPGAVTDADGKYTLISPPFVGRTLFCAVKESVGYPDTTGLLFSSGQESMPEQHLSPGAHMTVDIRLGPPDGTFEGSVLDAKTHSPVPKARISLHRDAPESMYSGTLPPDGHFFFAFPPFPISITILAPGYRPWKYRDPITGADKLVLGSADHRAITVEFIPQ
jgi:hypothetical protein